MSVLVVAGSKGGSGKTLVSLCLSGHLARVGADFVLVLISADIGPRENADIQCVAALISVETHR